MNEMQENESRLDVLFHQQYFYYSNEIGRITVSHDEILQWFKFLFVADFCESHSM